MLLTSARSVPDMALASRDSLAGSNLSVPSSLATLTKPFSGWLSVPNGPFTVICSALKDASTPLGSAMGILPTRDILHSLRYVANHFATDTGCACFTVGHHALRRRHDRHAQAVHHAGDLILALVDTQARTGHALKTLDYRTAGIIFQTNLQLDRKSTRLNSSHVKIS